jgi:hypothetical protein
MMCFTCIALQQNRGFVGEEIFSNAQEKFCKMLILNTLIELKTKTISSPCPSELLDAPGILTLRDGPASHRCFLPVF